MATKLISAATGYNLAIGQVVELDTSPRGGRIHWVKIKALYPDLGLVSVSDGDVHQSVMAARIGAKFVGKRKWVPEQQYATGGNGPLGTCVLPGEDDSELHDFYNVQLGTPHGDVVPAVPRDERLRQLDEAGHHEHAEFEAWANRQTRPPYYLALSKWRLNSGSRWYESERTEHTYQGFVAGRAFQP